MTKPSLDNLIPEFVRAIAASVDEHPGIHHLDRLYLPNRESIVTCVNLLRELAFPGFFGRQPVPRNQLNFHLGSLASELADSLFDQVRSCLRFAPATADACDDCDAKARDIVAAFFRRLPAVRALLATDVQAAFDSDPAATSTDETVYCYPGIFAIFVQRMAHEFFTQGVPMLPRIMTEYAHAQTGIDIHPGATLGPSFFIDHGTGVVIGETTVIGRNVKVYQGVTLGALAPNFGQLLRGTRRHPTIEDDVILYAGATILGGDTVIGKGSIINGNVFITASVPQFTQVSAEKPGLHYRQRRRKTEGPVDDYQI